jgi:hypothetical protein
MSSRRLLATGVSLVVLLGLSAVWGQKAEVASPIRPLDERAVAIRLLLGVGDRELLSWDGKVSVDKGEVVAVEGWRFRQNDRVIGGDSWETRTRPRPLPAAKKKAALAKARAQGKGAALNPVAMPNGVVVTLKVPDEAKLTVQTERGEFTVPVARVADGAVHRFLDGRVEAQRVPASVPVFDGPDQEDFPSAAADAAGNAWVAFVAHKARGPAILPPLRERPKTFVDFVPEGGGDQVRLIRFADGKPDEPIDVTAEGLDVWRPALAVAGDGAVVVAWSEFKDGNWDLHRRRYDPGERSWSEPKRLTTAPGADADVVLATAPDGKVWMAWQAWRDGQADILLARVDEPDAPLKISDGPANEWSPALAIDKGGRVHVAFDSYAAGNYDVLLRTREADGSLGGAVAIADSPAFEARPSVATDSTGRVWVAYEERTNNWGKDWGGHVQTGEGSNLYSASAVRVRCLDGKRRLDAPDPVAGALPPLRTFNSFPRIATDRSGRVWLAYRHRLETSTNPVGGAWVGQVTTLSGPAWVAPQYVPRSDGMLDNRASLVVARDGAPLIVYDGDNRLRRMVDGVDHGIHIAALVIPSATLLEPVFAEVAPTPPGGGAPVHPDEAGDVARLRGHRVEAGGKSYRLLRGEFHRHTEISGDGANDGALEDMWRYALDCARLDWIGNGDHDNGNGKEYTWWLTQKTTDLYHSARHFTPMFTYERSVLYPHGHRNVMWARRGVRTLPRLQVAKGQTHDDTKMLYDQLNELGGICASHTSATTQMGTDWRDNDPRVEPVVEIFQGARNSSEHLGAPRAGRSSAEAPGGMQPYGMVWNALALQYRLGFQSSSDHVSTHISYAIAIAEDHSRAAILDAFRRRHCYAATDNILLDVRSGDHLMGDEFNSDGPVRLRILAHGTRPIAKVDIIKDFVYVYTAEPKRPHVEFEWTDDERREPGLSWYYVRVIQDDGEIAWGSPMWVHQDRAAAGE